MRRHVAEPFDAGGLVGGIGVEMIFTIPCTALPFRRFVPRCQGVLGWWAGGLVGWWAGGLVGWWAGGLVGWWAGGLVGWWAGGLVFSHADRLFGLFKGFF